MLCNFFFRNRTMHCHSTVVDASEASENKGILQSVHDWKEQKLKQIQPKWPRTFELRMFPNNPRTMVPRYQFVGYKVPTNFGLFERNLCTRKT